MLATNFTLLLFKQGFAKTEKVLGIQIMLELKAICKRTANSAM
jgi:hypothetical protein